MVDKMLALKALALARVQLDSALEHVDEVMKSLLTEHALERVPGDPSPDPNRFEAAANGGRPNVKELVQDRLAFGDIQPDKPRTSGQFATEVVAKVMRKRGKEIHVAELREAVAPEAWACERVMVSRGKREVPLYHQSLCNALIRLQQLGKVKPGHSRGWYKLTETGAAT